MFGAAVRPWAPRAGAVGRAGVVLVGPGGAEAGDLAPVGAAPGAVVGTGVGFEDQDDAAALLRDREPEAPTASAGFGLGTHAAWREIPSGADQPLWTREFG
ncbi:hypothetical protein [Saccharothrix sp. Mg75]|uniref:hypothetical protein n=1 Tax=Saccharothrix sp. Mg75 TaxID=3445357 RepID=UPI003EEE2746